MSAACGVGEVSRGLCRDPPVPHGPRNPAETAAHLISLLMSEPVLLYDGRSMEFVRSFEAEGT